MELYFPQSELERWKYYMDKEQKRGEYRLRTDTPADLLFMLPFAEIAGCGYCSL